MQHPPWLSVKWPHNDPGRYHGISFGINCIVGYRCNADFHFDEGRKCRLYLRKIQRRKILFDLYKNILDGKITFFKNFNKIAGHNQLAVKYRQAAIKNSIP
ncbi:MAG: hypothetical protein BWX93_01932 [Bacteroidetes bacterium ADurb.Bin139]|nr:MAG: hypothetical protein BWX93_01932 [Bacteroidetes bacterium ADurb.Bin139]